VNAPFDPGGIVEIAMRQMEEGQGPLVLSAAAPLDSARQLIRRRYMQPGARTIHHQQGQFYVWCGTHYRETAREEIRAEVYSFLDGAKRLDDKCNLMPFNPTRNKVGDVLDALAATAQLPGLVRAPSWLDDGDRPAAVDILGCTNGLIHLPTRTLLPHTPSFFGVNAVDYAYEPLATAPHSWLAFLSSIWPGDTESISTLQELLGLLLTPNTSHQKVFLIVGPKRSGKGTIGRILTALLGKLNVAGPTLSGLSQNFGLAPLIGKSLAIISDARLAGRTDAHVITERILAITGEDMLTIDRKYLPAWTGQLPTRFVILTNELPKLHDTSGALASRFIVLCLTKSFFGKEDLGLTHSLLAELPGVLIWAMEGRDRLAKRGHFIQPASAKQAVQELADLASPIGAFLRERCILAAGYAVECGQLFEVWCAWCRDNGRDHPGTTQTFGRDLRAAVPDLEIAQPRDQKTGQRLRYYQGVGLAP
jgi:putative DNA primase/helicase